jgi:hypothetical protein
MKITPQQRQLLLQLVCGHADAAEFCTLWCEVMHIWDDLIDKDKEVTDELINKVFWKALVELPQNPFYAAHFHLLNPVMMTAIQNWHAATDMEATDSDADKEIAFITRSNYGDVVIQAAYLTGGYEWARHVTLLIRREFHREGYAGYRRNLVKQAHDAAQLKSKADARGDELQAEADGSESSEQAYLFRNSLKD